jgi:dienelactone hydrolase
VAQVLQQAGLATLLMDLLTPGEEVLDVQTAALRFDIELLGGRLVETTLWLLEQPHTAQLPIGYFGASTGAAAALVAAAKHPNLVRPSSHAVGGRISPERHCGRWSPQRCSSSAVGTRWCSNSTAKLWPN